MKILDAILKRGMPAFAAFIAAVAATVFVFSPAHAGSVESLYKGKNLTILIGHPPGGSYDLYAQLAAIHMGKYIAGNPNVIVQHMPGGGGRKAASHYMNKVAADGMTIALLPDTLAHIQLLTPKRGKWDASKIRYIGRFAPANAAFAVRKDAPATTIEGMRKTELIVGCTGKSARSAQMPAALKNVGGFKLKLICGYKGSKGATLATLRGEVDMVSKNWAAFKSADGPEMASGNLKIVLQAGLERDKDLPNVPLLQEIVSDPQAKKVLEFIGSGAPIGRSLMAKPGTPDDVVTALRGAFQKMVKDPAFLSDAAKRKAIIDPATGEQVEAVNRDIFKADAALIKAANKALDTSGAGEVKKKK
ncbi:MAG: tripartite tricarboxylate transporter substrate-binding protein [Rhodospirillales bacterium]|nr:tripartite tricarboxylate transporter substrate-binding protein [Rhodospirillales bacterium]